MVMDPLDTPCSATGADHEVPHVSRRKVVGWIERHSEVCGEAYREEWEWRVPLAARRLY